MVSDIDTGVAALPGVRPSVFTPPNPINASTVDRPLVAVDYGVGSTPAALLNVFDDFSNTSVVASPGY